MGVLRTALTALWTSLLLALLAIWITTAAHLGMRGAESILAVLVFIPLLFQVEGLELAVAALRGREAAALSGRSKRELDLIQCDPKDSFFPNRQVFVVLSIVLLTIAASFDRIFVPGVGWVADNGIPFWFNVALPTLIVLLLAQVPSKRLALHNPERFYAASWQVCVIVRYLGRSAVTEPAELVVSALKKLLRYPIAPRTPLPHHEIQYDPLGGEWVIYFPDSSSGHEQEADHAITGRS